MTAQATDIFGKQSSIYQDLVNTFAPTVANGPNQQGFSAQELANLNSQAITSTGQSYRNAKQALGDQQAAAAGGRAVLPGGATTGQNLGLAEGAANQTAGELGQITQANYATGRQNYLAATQGLAGAGNVYGAANQTAGTANSSGGEAANTANQVAQENNSWVQAVTGALGGVAGAAVTGGMSLLGGAGGQTVSGLYNASNAATSGLSATNPYSGGISPTSYVPAPGF